MITNSDHQSATIATAVELIYCDPRLAKIISDIGPCLLERREQGFVSLVRSIISQQLSKSAAQSIRLKLESLFEDNVMNPEQFLILKEEEFLTTGLSRPKTKYIKDLADLILSGKINFDELESMDDEAIIQALTRIKGIGRWTAQMYLMFSMNRLDVFPLDDVAIRNAIRDIYDLPKENFDDKARSIAEHWRPFRTVACWYLYQYLNGLRANKQKI